MQLAIRLALLCGRLDVESMLAEITTEQWDLLEAADRLGLVPDPWMQTGRLAATIANRLEPILAYLCGTKGTTVQAADFIPGKRGRSRRERRRLSVRESEAAMRARYKK